MANDDPLRHLIRDEQAGPVQTGGPAKQPQPLEESRDPAGEHGSGGAVGGQPQENPPAT
jgi:hypothetical protein